MFTVRWHMTHHLMPSDARNRSHVGVDVESVLAQAERLFASFSIFY